MTAIILSYIRRATYLLLGLLPWALAAQTVTYTLKGQTLDRDTWLPLSHVKVQIPDRPITTYSDTSGNFSLRDTLPIIGLSFTCKHYYDKYMQVASNAERIITYLQRKLDDAPAQRDTLIHRDDRYHPSLQADTLPVAEVSAVGFGTPAALLQIAGAVSVVTPQIFAREQDGTPLPALNTVAGVRVEERSPGSYRIAIRGSNLLRAPFGIRNLKTYWNELPLTDARGTTAINLLDLSTVSTAEIIKGPAGSLYGAGNGGVLLLRQEAATLQRSSAEIGMSVGSFGTFRHQQAASIGNQRSALALQYVHHQSEGYRQHTAFERDMLAAHGRFYLGSRHSWQPFLVYSRVYYEIPGGLTLEEYNTNRRQARPDFIVQNASVAQQTLLGGLAYRYQTRRWATNIALSGSHTAFDNPFTTNYKTEESIALNSRATLTYQHIWGKTNWHHTVGGEAQWANITAGNLGNRQGNRDTLHFSDDIAPLQYLAFAQTEIGLPRQWRFNAALSYSQLRYALRRTDYLQSISTDTLTFAGVWSPRIALSKTWGKRWAIHGSLSYGFSPPVLDEIRTSDGSINHNLAAERGMNYEIGGRANLANSRLFIDACAYWLRIADAMVRYTTDNGTVLFQNAGATDNRGVELMLRYQWLHNAIAPNDKHAWLSQLDTWASYTYSNYVFDKYIDKGIDYSGNPLTGTPPHVCVVGIDAAMRLGFYAHLTYTFTDRVPLNDAHTVFANTLHNLRARWGWQCSIGRFSANVYMGGDNLLNQMYSLGNDLNAFSNRYYQPAATRTWNGGAQLTMRF